MYRHIYICIQNQKCSQKPGLGTILNVSGTEFCSSSVVSNLTLIYSKVQP